LNYSGAMFRSHPLRLGLCPQSRSVGLRIRGDSGSMIGMSQTRVRRQPGPPHNPGVRELVEGKRRWSSPPKREDAMLGFRGWHERGYLPHRDEPDLAQFVTFRLADSFPEALRSEWEQLLRLEDDRNRRAELEAYLDEGRGNCLLRQAEVAWIAEDAIRFFHGQRYELRAWCIMPNHAHVLFNVRATPMAEIVESWKKHSAYKANRILGRRGSFWADGYFDIYMRDAEHERRTVAYIENNPSRARLVLDPKEWRWSSARFRDAFGVLQLLRSAAMSAGPAAAPPDAGSC